MTISLNELILYWQGELPRAREEEVEDALFADPSVERRLAAVAALEASIRTLVARGKVESGLTVEGVRGLAESGLSLRSYEVEAGQTVPCTIAAEDLVVIRLRGKFEEAERVDVIMDGTFEGMGESSERYEDVPIDRQAGEVVLVYPGDRIRALPRSRFRYSVTSEGRSLGEFGLDHTPPA